MVCATSNVKGFTDLKIIEFILHMKTCSIDVLCIQETRTITSQVNDEQDHMIILSGSDSDSGCWAGVGFIVAPRCRYHIKSYKLVSERICSVEVRVKGGIVNITGVYAPHNMKPLDERIQFFFGLDAEYRKCSANMGKFIIGDISSRICHQQPGEDHIIGSHSFGRQGMRPVDVPFRDLLMELCEGQFLLLANTFMPGDVDAKVTFMEPGSTFLGPITEQGYNMLNLLLFDMNLLQKCLEMRSERGAALATDHYLVKIVLRFEAPEPRARNCKQGDVGALKDILAQANFAAVINDTMHMRADAAGDCNELWSAMKDAMLAAAETLPAKTKAPNKTIAVHFN